MWSGGPSRGQNASSEERLRDFSHSLASGPSCLEVRIPSIMDLYFSLNAAVAAFLSSASTLCRSCCASLSVAAHSGQSNSCPVVLLRSATRKGTRFPHLTHCCFIAPYPLSPILSGRHRREYHGRSNSTSQLDVIRR